MNVTHWARRGKYIDLKTQQPFALIQFTVSPDQCELVAVIQELYEPYRIYCRPGIQFADKTWFKIVPGQYALLELSLPEPVQHTEMPVQYSLDLVSVRVDDHNEMQYVLKMRSRS